MKRQKQHKAIVLGLTGSFGSGKSTVAAIFKSFGAKIIDADKLAHECVSPGKRAYKKIVSFFGKGILCKDRAIDRARLGNIVFADIKKLKALNNIVHPEVIREIKNQIKNAKEKTVVLDVPLLVEAGLGKLADKIIVVRASQEKQIRRLRKKIGLSRSDILKRIKAQIPLRIKARMADFVIDNSGSVSKTKEEVKKVWSSLA